MEDGNIKQFAGFQSEIIGKPPGNITSYGITVIFFFVLIIMFFAWKIDYSDSIKARIVINSRTPTINVIAENIGNINQIFVTSGTKINAGDNVVLLQSDSDIGSVNKLKMHLLEGGLTKTINANPIQGNLGPIRPDYQQLQNSINQLLKIKNTLSTKLKVQQLQNDKISLSHQLLDLKSQKSLSIQKNTINQEKYNRSLSLSNKNLITKNELGQSKTSLIDAKLSSSSIELEINRVESTLYNNGRQIEIYTLENEELQLELVRKIKSQQQALLDKINSWERRYIIKAPISGTLSLPNNVFIHQNISSNQELFSINPDANKLIGKIKIPENGAGKIVLGQLVDIKLDSYPFQEFGKVSGIVKNKSHSVHDSSIFIDIEVNNYLSQDNILLTSYNKKIQYIPNMQGQIEIITNKKNILSRVFENLIARF